MIGHIGHIGAPELSRHIRPGIAEQNLLPATLAPELLQDLLLQELLRGELAIHGMIPPTPP
ncbi:hypothetical protein [Arthrobacter sp. UYCu723]